MNSEHDQTDLIAKAYENARVEHVHARTRKTSACSMGTNAGGAGAVGAGVATPSTDTPSTVAPSTATLSTNTSSTATPSTNSSNTGDTRYLKVIAPAKVNLYLAVGERQESGYHPVENVMHTLLIHDVLYMRAVSCEETDAAPAQGAPAQGTQAQNAPAQNTQTQNTQAQNTQAQNTQAQSSQMQSSQTQSPQTQSPQMQSSQMQNVQIQNTCPQNSVREGFIAHSNKGCLNIHLTCSGASGITPPCISAEENIVYKALSALWHELGRTGRETMDVHLEKHLPHQAGLGGGSSDAAAALVGAARLWGVCETDKRIERVARTLGADVAFFLQGGCALFNGVGDTFVRSMQTCNSPVVLIMPEGGLSTAQVYEAFDKQPHVASNAQKCALAQATHASDIELFNALAPAACSLNPELEEIHAWATTQPGVTHVLLTGSGSCTYAVCETTNAALAIVSRARARGWWAACTYFANVRAAAQ